MIMAELIYLMEAITEQADTERRIWVLPLQANRVLASELLLKLGCFLDRLGVGNFAYMKLFT